VIALGAVLASCVTTAPIVNPSSQIQLYGVSSLPPQNGSWRVITASGYQASFGKSGGKEDESLVANMYIYKLPALSTDEAFLSHVQEGQAAEPDIGRFEILKNDQALAMLNGAHCVSYHSVSKDNSAKTRGGDVAAMLLENRGYHCMHPRNHTVGVNIEYSLRHYPDTSYQSFGKDAESFFTNVRFTEF
jgi:hypothetical protein